MNAYYKIKISKFIKMRLMVPTVLVNVLAYY